jgi:hypothetical protein
MVAGIWFHWMSESDLRRVIGPGSVLVFLLLPGFVALLQMTIAPIPTVLVIPHGLALTKAITPAFGVQRILEVARDILAEFSADRPGSLPATAATIIEAIGEGGRVTFGEQVFVG